MTDVERLFRRLVDILAATDPGRLGQPITLGDLVTSIVPYRANRRALGFDSSEDYELVVLRLAAGEGGFARTLSPQAGDRLRREVASPNPDLGLVIDLAAEPLVLDAEAISRALADRAANVAPEPASSAPAPPAAAPPPPLPRVLVAEEPEPDLVDLPPADPMSEVALPLDEVRVVAIQGPAGADDPAAGRAEPPLLLPDPFDGFSGTHCGFCGGELPTGRTVNFCPHCGEPQQYTRCPECKAEVEFGWRHCIVCGHRMAEA
ncbi:MAG: double zinc ribbon domain-containing protein [Gemmatimonadota bacterium]